MNPALLIEQFESVADDPGAVPRLRRLILDLAVRGKLVPQERKDSPASELLEQIRQEQERLIEAGEIPKKKLTSGAVESVPFQLPPSWAWTRLARLTSYIQRGKSPKYTDDTNSPIVVSQKCVRWKELDLAPARHINRESLNDYEPYRFIRDGDILWNSTGTGTIGRVVCVIDPPTKLVCDTHVTVVRCLLVDPQYIRLWLLSDYVYGQIEEAAAGSTNQIELTLQMAENQLVPLPPLAEQSRIVGSVGSLMELCDNLQAAQKQREKTRDQFSVASLASLVSLSRDVTRFIPQVRAAVSSLDLITVRHDEIDHVRQTILNLAVRGTLVRQDKNEEDSRILLERIAQEQQKRRRDSGDQRITSGPQPSAETLPMSLPPGWSIQSFENLFLFIDYRGKTPAKTSHGIPLITAKNIRMGYLNQEPREYVSPKTYESWMTRGFPKIGDLLFTTEAPLANICINNIEGKFALAQRVICLQPYDTINTAFIMYALMSDLMQAVIHSKATGLTAKGIKAAKLKPLPIPIPPLPEQERIVSKIEQLMSVCSELEQTLKSGERTRQRLLESLIADALRTADEGAQSTVPLQERHHKRPETIAS